MGDPLKVTRQCQQYPGGKRLGRRWGLEEEDKREGNEKMRAAGWVEAQSERTRFWKCSIFYN